MSWYRLFHDRRNSSEEDVKSDARLKFDKFSKPVFKDASETAFIKYGSMGCNDSNVKIRRGPLFLTGHILRTIEHIARDLYNIDSIISEIRQTTTRWFEIKVTAVNKR